MIVWGAIWGCVLAVWIIAPEALKTHNLYPGNLGPWTLLVGFFLAVGALFGLVLSAAFSVPAALVWLRRPPVRAPDLAAALWALAVTPIGYFAVSLGIETARYRELVSADPRRLPMQLALAGAVAGIFALIAVYRRLAADARWRDAGRLRAVSAVLIVAGVAALPFRLTASAEIPESPAPPLSRGASRSSTAPVVVVGFDGGNWATLKPLIDSGKTPFLAGLVKAGMHGEVEALWPPYWSGPAWAAIVTGQPPAVNGVTGDLVGTAPGLPPFEIPLELNVRLNPLYAVELGLVLDGIVNAIPMPRAQLKRAPVWERVAAAGGRVAVVRFPFTYPAREVPGSVTVANIISNDLWGGLVDVAHLRTEDLVSPPALVAPLARRFSADPDADSPALREIFPPRTWPKPPNTPEHPVSVLGRIFDVNEKTFDAAEAVLRHSPGVDLVMLHVSSFDSICHAFWKFRFPEQFPEKVADADVQALGGVIDRYLIYLDRRLQRVMALLPSTPNVIVAADHGQEAVTSHVMWNGWHGRYGVFIASGPGIPRRDDRVQVSYFDIAPLVLDLLGFDRPADLAAARSILR